MASIHNDEAAGATLLSPPTTAGSNPGPRAGKTFSGGAESQARNARPPTGHGRKRQAVTESRASRYRGVQWDRNGGRWRARIHTDRTRHIGYFESEDEAAMAWDMAVLRYFGEADGRKKLNFGEASIARYRQEPNAQPQAINPRISAKPSSRTTSAGEDVATTYRGVMPHDGGTFRAMIMKNRLSVTVGVFATAEEAARAHDCAALEAHGWGTLTNFPLSDYEIDGNGRPVITAAKRQQQQQQQQTFAMPPPGPPQQDPQLASNGVGTMRRQASLPIGAPTRDNNNTANAQRMLRSASNTSVELGTLLHGRPTAGPTTLHHLAAAAQQAGWHHPGLTIVTPPAPTFSVHHHPQQGIQVTMNGAPGMAPQPLTSNAHLMGTNTAMTLQMHQQQQQMQQQREIAEGIARQESEQQRKRLRCDDNNSSEPSRGSDGTTRGSGEGKSNTATGTGDGSGGDPPGTTQGSPMNNHTNHINHINRSPSTSPPPVETTAAVAGVRQLQDGSYQAALYIDLGSYGSYDEAVRAYDRAALMTSGFAAPTHCPLPDAVMRSATASGGGPPQLVPAAVANGISSRFRGVTRRGGSFLATLDIGGKAYELGPFATEVDAAKAYDRYSMMLKGVAAQTNFPPWEHLASSAEVSALVEAVGVVALNTSERQLSGAGGGSAGMVVQTPHSGLTLAPPPQALPLLSPMMRASSDLERLQTQLNELQAHAIMHQQAQQAQQPMVITHSGTAVPLSSVLNVPMGHQTYSMHGMPTNLNFGVGIDPSNIAVHSSLVRMPSSSTLAMPSPSAALPAMIPALPAGTLPGSQGPVNAAVGALAAAAQLEQQLAATPVSGGMTISLPGMHHGHTHTHGQSMFAAGSHSVGVTMPRAAPTVTANTQDTVGMQQQTASSGGAPGPGGHMQHQQQQQQRATPSIAGMDRDFGHGHHWNMQSSPTGTPATGTATAAAAAATAAADAATAVVHCQTLPTEVGSA